MGAVCFSIDERLVKALKEALPLTTFVETGTFKGDAIAIAAPYVDRVLSVEFSKPLWKESSARFKADPRIKVLFGNSPDVISRIRAEIGDASTLYWLDAHWCVATNTAGDKSQCPLLAEIFAIGKLGESSVILVDDARLFLAPPPEPHDVTQWPTFDQVLLALRSLSDAHEVMVVNDVIAFYPRAIKHVFEAYARHHGIDWLRASQSMAENPQLRQAVEEKEALIHAQDGSLQEKEALIRSQHRSLEEKEMLIHKQQHALHTDAPAGRKQQRALEEKEEVLQRLHRELQEKELVIRRQQDALAEAGRQAEAHARHVSESDGTIHALHASLQDKDVLIQGLNAAMEQLRAQHQQLVAELQAKDAAMRNLHDAAQHAQAQHERILADVGERDRLVARLDQALAHGREQHAELAAQLGAKHALIASLEGALRTNQEQHALLAEAVEQKEAVLGTLTQALAEKESVVATFTQALADKESVVATLKQALAEKESAIQALQKAGGSTHAHLALLRGLEEKEAVIQELNGALQAYRSAFSGMQAFIGPIHLISTAFRYLRQSPTRLVTPRLGNLNQHAPVQLRIPSHYTRPPALQNPPTICVVTPSFRQAGFIERTIRSVIDQGYPCLEYHVQDGASEDGTREILEKYSDRLTSWDSSPDSGQTQAINRGFARTKGEIMAWLNSDDVLFPGTLAYVAAYFARHPEVDVVYGHRLLIDENDLEIGRWILPAHDDRILSWADFVPQETLFWRRRIWEKVGAHVDESFRFAMDWDLLVRFRDAGARFARLPRFLGGFRIHPHQKTSAVISDVGFKEMDRIRQRALGKLPTHIEIRKAVFPYLLKHCAADLAWRVRSRLGVKT